MLVSCGFRAARASGHAHLDPAAHASPPPAGRAYLPPAGQVYQGVAGPPISGYQQAVGKHPAVYQVFAAWGEYLPAMFADAAAARARLMIHITTASGPREMITPEGIAEGRGDVWLIALNQAMYASGHVTYIRLMAEMDGYWNPYSAFNADGSPRDAAHSPRAFKRAWKRVTLILRGGSRPSIDRRLARLGMPALAPGAELPRPMVAMLWVAQVAGSPDLAGNSPAAYWPGRGWVDWVGADFYGKFPNFSGLNSFYAAFPGEPFVFGEYALWGADDPGFIERLLTWIGTHPRVRMLIYNQGTRTDGPFALGRYPNATLALRRLLASPVFPSYTADWAPG